MSMVPVIKKSPIQKLFSYLDLKDNVIIKDLGSQTITLQIIGRYPIKITLCDNVTFNNDQVFRSELRYYSSVYNRNYIIVQKLEIPIEKYTNNDYSECAKKLSQKIKSYLRR